MHASERERIIMAELGRQPFIGVAELVAATKASEATVRRDLKRLADSGRVNRVRGGVEMRPRPTAVGHLQGTPFQRNLEENIAAKRAIAARAAALIAPGEPVIIDGGTTTFQMCPHLMTRDAQVLTNSLPIADQLIRNAACRLLMPAGEIFREQNIVLSPFDEDGIAHYAASKMFMGAAAITAAGLHQADSVLIRAERKLIDRARELIVLVDSSKFDRVASLILCPLERISRLITDEGISELHAAMLRDAGVALEIVPSR